MLLDKVFYHYIFKGKNVVFFSFFILLLLQACKPDTNTEKNRLTAFSRLNFEVVPSEVSGVQFVNKITEGKVINYFTYPNMYSGGGVALGDINNDGLADIYFGGNMIENKLYLNKGDLKFKDITSSAGVGGFDVVRWTRGITMIDINNDGWLDIYISISDPPGRRNNLLYINQGDLTFKEEAVKYGIDDDGNSVQSVFFDYDKDGDLDLYICTYPPFSLHNSNAFFKAKNEAPQLAESDKFYRNDGNGKFTEVTEESGLLNYGLTLNASIADFNNDGWPDIYVSNDFNAKDFMYINNGNGTFSDKLETYFPHTSNFGMGTDAADFNNDGHIDLFQCDMMSSNNIGKKTNMSAMNPKSFFETVSSGLHYQYMRNCLQMNNGNNKFSDIAEMTGVGYTDWSWAALFADLNNDGWKDLFVSNGIRKNVNNNDYQNFSNRLFLEGRINKENQYKLIDFIPENPIDNNVFVNKGGWKFENKTNNWGLSYKGYTHGVATADLDLDGDLDMVFNNQDDVSLVFENKARQTFKEKNYLRIRFKGGENNRLGLGTRVDIKTHDGSIQTQELILSRGYQSSVEPALHFGLGAINIVESIRVTWPDGSIEELNNIKGNQELIIEKGTVNKKITESISIEKPLFVSITEDIKINYKHQENLFDDFKIESLLPHRMSQFGPALAVGDINKDGLDDLFVGGAKGQSGQLFLQDKNKGFNAIQSVLFESDKNYEDTGAAFFDADNDGDLDLYIVSGGNEKEEGSPYYTDRFYENKEGEFYKNTTTIPEIRSSGSCVVPYDYDNDGDIDLFVGARQIPGKYPKAPSSQLLRNNCVEGKCYFEDVTQEIAPMLKNIGMVTDAKWVDINNDDKKDLVISGEWMAIKILKNSGEILEDISPYSGLENETGWWNNLSYGDFDNDGDIDIVAGNLGLNYKYKASNEYPFKIYAKDFDSNNTIDIVLGYYEDGKLYPLRGRECSSNQMPFIKKKFHTYKSFAEASLEDVYGKSNLRDGIKYEAKNFATSYLENLGKGKFKIRPLDYMAQLSSINSIVVKDFNADGNLDLVMAGNLFGSEVETPRNDAGYGMYMMGNGKGEFKALSPIKSGLLVEGEIKQVVPMKLSKETSALVFARNNGSLQFISYSN